MKIALVYYRFLDELGDRPVVGGIETYLHHLAEAFSSKGWNAIIFQAARTPFERQLGAYRVVGVPTGGAAGAVLDRALLNAAKAQLDRRRDVIVFGTDHCSLRVPGWNAVSIQHGVSWDLPTEFHTQRWWLRNGLGRVLKQARLVTDAVRSFDRCANRVCVDYNYPNWYRAVLGRSPPGRHWVIPNASAAAPREEVERREFLPPFRILFARRFTAYRGARVMIGAMQQLLSEQRPITVTFAGEGPEEKAIRAAFPGDGRVSVSSYRAQDAVGVHLAHDVAVIPSLASEGTSLSVAEAMAAGCVPLASAVGGITNMVIDGYNGLFAVPRADAVAARLRTLIESPETMRMLSANAFNTAAAAFGLAQWQAKWIRVIEDVCG